METLTTPAILGAILLTVFAINLRAGILLPDLRKTLVGTILDDLRKPGEAQ